MTTGISAVLSLIDKGFTAGLSAAKSVMKKFEEDTEHTRHAVNKFEKGLKNAGDSMSGYIKSAVGIAAAYMTVNQMVTVYKDWSAAATEARQQEDKLRQIMSNTAGNTKESADAILSRASALQQSGVVEGDTLVAASQMAATFQLQGKTLEKLMPAMADVLAQQKGYNATAEDGVQIGNLFGKAMSGQVGALQRVGINFTDAQKEVLQFGNEQEKVATLLQVVKANVGGVNAALAQTPEGAIARTKAAWGDLTEAMGGKFLSATLPVANFLNSRLPQIQEFLGGAIDWTVQKATELSNFFKTELYPRFVIFGGYITQLAQTIFPNLSGTMSGAGDVAKNVLLTGIDGVNRVMKFFAEHGETVKTVVVLMTAAWAAQKVQLMAVAAWTTITAVRQGALMKMMKANPFVIIAAGAIAWIKVIKEMSDKTSVLGGDIRVLTSGLEGLGAIANKVKGFVQYLFTGEISQEAADAVAKVDALRERQGLNKKTTEKAGESENYDAEGSFATGSPYIPHDNFRAILHKGERVMTAKENQSFTQQSTKTIQNTFHNVFNISGSNITAEDVINQIVPKLEFAIQNARG